MTEQKITIEERACDCEEQFRIVSLVTATGGGYLQVNCLNCGAGWSEPVAALKPPPANIEKE
jgi:hypothetical protein